MRLLVLDIEATGVDPLTDRMVTLFVGVMEDTGKFSDENNWMFNPGIEIPEAASEVHGISTETAVRDGLKPEDHARALAGIRQLIVDTVRNQNLPVVAFNAAYDLTMLNSEFKRNGVPVINWDDLFIVDPFVIDKEIDKWRKGSRTLVSVATFYKIEVDETKAHDAAYDCYLAGRLTQELSKKAQVAVMSRTELHNFQKKSKRDQAASFQSYLRKKNNDDTVVINGEWPVLSS
jgi:DNA polymerase-3 subunit epsilon